MAGRNPTLGGELMFPSRFLKNEDLKGRDVVLTISRVVIEEMQIAGTTRTERGIVMYFAEMEKRGGDKDDRNKRLVVNKTNARTLAELYGGEANQWVGKRITVWPTTCRFGADAACPCIRIRDRVPAAKRGGESREAPPSEEEEAPRDELEEGDGAPAVDFEDDDDGTLSAEDEARMEREMGEAG